MSQIAGKIAALRKICGMTPLKEYQHFGADTAVPMHLQRFISELEYALRLSEALQGKWDNVLSKAVDFAMAKMKEEGILTIASVGEGEAILSPMAADAKKYTVHMVSHAHIDMNWMWPWQETVSVTLETFRTVLRLMEEFPDFTYSQSQASTYQIVEEYEPEMLELIKKRIHEGRWEVSASTWVEADKNMPNEESMVRHLLYTKQYLSKLLEIDPETLNLDYEPDTFGHSENVPDLLTQGGVKYYYHCRGYEGDPVFRWQAPSGREVLVFCEPTWYLGTLNPNFVRFVPSFCEEHGLADSIKVYGVGDHGGGPTRQDLSYILEMQKWPIFPKLEFSSYKAFFSALEARRDTYPVVRRELNFVFSGCYTTQARIKAANRQGEARLSEAETLSSMAEIYTGRKVREAALKDAWKKVLFSQFHDILPGSCMRDPREYALGSFQKVTAVTGVESVAAMRTLSEAVDTSSVTEKGNVALTVSEGAGVGFGARYYQPSVAERGTSLTRIIHLYNASSMNAELPAEIELWDYPGDLEKLEARTLSGEKIALQVISEPENWFSHNMVRVLLNAPVPAFGWNTVVLEENDELTPPLTFPLDPRVHQAPEFTLENEQTFAKFDPKSGALVSLFDKTSQKELLSGPAGFLKILEDTDAGMSAWVVGRYRERELLSEKIRIAKGISGELRNSLLFSADFGENHLKCEISLDKGSRFLKYKVECEWNELGMEDLGIPQLAFAAPLKAPFDEVLYDVPAGYLKRKPTGMDVPSQTFAAPVVGDGAPALVLAGDSKYGFRADDGFIQMTLIRSPFNPDPAPERGEHTFEIYLGTSEMEDAARSAQRMLLRVRSASVRPHKGTLAPEGTLLSCDTPEIRLGVLKPAEDGNGWILRLVNTGDARECFVKTTLKVGKASLCDVLEKDLTEVEVTEDGMKFTAEGHATLTLRMVLA